MEVTILSVLRVHGQIGHIDGTISPPPKFLIDEEGNISKEINPLFTTWFQQDQNILSWINATLSKGILAHVVGLNSSHDVCLAVKRRFASLC